jgi:triacylglycerol lipase
MTTVLRVLLALTIIVATQSASSQVSPEMAEMLAAIGPIISPTATASLYAPRMVETEPYRNAKVERDLAYGPSERNLLDVFEPIAEGPRPGRCWSSCTAVPLWAATAAPARAVRSTIT